MIPFKFSLVPLLVCLIISIHLSYTTASSYRRQGRKSSYVSRTHDKGYNEKGREYGKSVNREQRRDTDRDTRRRYDDDRRRTERSRTHQYDERRHKDYDTTGRREVRYDTDRRYSNRDDKRGTDRYNGNDGKRRDDYDNRYAEKGVISVTSILDELRRKKERKMKKFEEKRRDKKLDSSKYNELVMDQAKYLVKYETTKIYVKTYGDRPKHRPRYNTWEERLKRLKEKKKLKLSAFDAAEKATLDDDIHDSIDIMRRKYLDKWNRKNSVARNYWKSVSSSSDVSSELKYSLKRYYGVTKSAYTRPKSQHRESYRRRSEGHGNRRSKSSRSSPSRSRSRSSWSRSRSRSRRSRSRSRRSRSR